MRNPKAIMIKGVDRANDLATQKGRLSNLWVLNEYPKSGGTWVAKVIASSLDLPYVEDLTIPVVNSSVIRTHWRPNPARNNTVHLMRDGRDVMVSLFHHRVRMFQVDPSRNQRTKGRFDFELDPHLIRDQLARFLEVELGQPGGGASINWGDFVQAQLNCASPSEVITYEQMLDDPVTHLCRVLAAKGKAIPESRVASAVALHDRSNAIQVSGKPSSVLRQGKAGGWQDVFNDEALEVFERYCGNAMKLAGYVV